MSVVLALRDRQEVIELELPEGSDVAAALDASRLAERFPGIDLSLCEVGVWSAICGRERVLREGDRVEIYRPLFADPKTLRRERALKRKRLP